MSAVRPHPTLRPFNGEQMALGHPVCMSSGVPVTVLEYGGRGWYLVEVGNETSHCHEAVLRMAPTRWHNGIAIYDDAPRKGTTIEVRA